MTSAIDSVSSRLKLRPARIITPRDRATLLQVREARFISLQVKLHDTQAVLASLARYLGMFVDRHVAEAPSSFMKDTTLQERQARAEEILETSKSGKGSLDGSATRFRTDPPGWQRHRNRLSKDLFEIRCDSQAVEFRIRKRPAE